MGLALDMPLKAQDTGREPKSHLGWQLLSLQRLIRHMTPWDRDRWGQIYIHSGRDVRSGSHRRRALLLLLTCQSCRKPGGIRWGETPPR